MENDDEKHLASGIPESLLKEMAARAPGALLTMAARLLGNLRDQSKQLNEVERKLLDFVGKRLSEEALGETLAACVKDRESVAESARIDHFPDIERKGLLKTLGLRFYITPCKDDLFTISGDVPDVASGHIAQWAHMRRRVPGETDDEALRAAILEFFEYETDHALWRAGRHIRDPHDGEDPNSI